MNASTTVFTAALLALVAQVPAVAQSDPRYGADVVLLMSDGNHLFHGQTRATGSSTTGVGGAVFAEGSAGLNGPVDLTATATDGLATSGAIARVDIFDTLTFHIASGGAAVFSVRMDGDWAAQGVGSKVTYGLRLASSSGDHTYEGYSFSHGVAESFASGIPVAPALVIDSGNVAAGVIGSYAVAALFGVNDGGVYSFSATVGAEAEGLSSAFIEDPLTFELPAGVTFSAASNNPYAIAAVPEPSTWWLMSVGLIGLAKLRRDRRGASPVL